MELLDVDNILNTEEIEDLFVDTEDNQETLPDKKIEKEDPEENAEFNVDELFSDPDESSDSDDKIEKGENTDSKKGNISPKENNFYSSIAKALKEDGIFPDLDNLDTIKNPEDFAEIVEKQIISKLDEKQKRIDNALNVGVGINDIQKFENTIKQLDSINEESIVDESNDGEKLRQQLIYQDFINRGYSDERAKREVKKSFNSGTDIEDAKEALNSNKEYFKEEYDALIQEHKDDKIKEQQLIKEQSEKLRKSILEDNKVFGEIVVDKSTRQKVFDNISKPIYKDPKSGELFTALQQYERENKIDFLKNIGLLFTLTNGFKDINTLVKDKVKKEVKKGIRDLEHTINNTSRTSDGNLKYASSIDDDPEVSIGKGWDLDV